VFDKSGNEVLVDVFDSIEAESCSTIAEDRMDPRSPVEQIIPNVWMSLVDIGTHWAS